MPDEAPSAPAGWYPDPKGGQRYWDGESWLNIPAPPQDLSEQSLVSDSDVVSKTTTSRTRLFIWIALGVVALVAIVAVSIQSSNQAAFDKEQAAMAQEQRAAEASKAAEAAKTSRVLEERTKQVATIVESVKGSAQKLLDEGVITGSIIDAYCNPVAGGSLGDITESTTAFECFVATKDNGDGTQNGYFWDVTQNWDSGRYTWSFRKN